MSDLFSEIEIEDFQRNNPFLQYDQGLSQEPLSFGAFGILYLGHHYYFFTLSDPCPGVKMTISIEIIHFHYMISILILSIFHYEKIQDTHNGHFT